jgi:parallel beta-helix repeat protein
MRSKLLEIRAFSIILILVCVYTITFGIQSVNASTGTIYIRADGSIDPPASPIQRNGESYTLVSNISFSYDGIMIESDNLVLDGAGYTIEGANAYNSKGIGMIGRDNLTIRNLTIKGFDKGIYLYYSSNSSVFENSVLHAAMGIYVGTSSSNNVISGNNIAGAGIAGIFLQECSSNNISENTITASRDGILLDYNANDNNVTKNIVKSNYGVGIWVYYSSGNTLRNNNMLQNKYNFDITSSSILHFDNDVDTSNTVDGKPIRCWINESDKTVPTDSGYVALVNCTRIIVQGLELTRNGQGLVIGFTTNSTIARNNITENDYGVYLCSSSNNNICENNIKGNLRNLRLDSSNHNCIIGNKIETGGRGIWLIESSNNTIHHNNFTSNEQQVWDSSKDMWQYGNQYGKYTGPSPYAPSVNAWDDGSEGNFWSDYNGTDADYDGIGDTPYIIDESNQDNHPLVDLKRVIEDLLAWLLSYTKNLMCAFAAATVILIGATVYLFKKQLKRTSAQKLE